MLSIYLIFSNNHSPISVSKTENIATRNTKYKVLDIEQYNFLLIYIKLY